ncbi:MAG: RecX family transcriptional regulator [Rhodospirillales bacterium]|nr:RecX family transcriptional regulator [Rhodospirillales bacterium]
MGMLFGMKKAPRRITAASLENAALHYLERFATSSENLRRVLCRKVMRAAQAHGDDPAEGMALIEPLIERYRLSGVLDDGAYAEMKARSLHRRGGSERMIRAKLAARGVAAPEIDDGLAALDSGSEDREWQAALAFARRRRLGPFRPAELRAQHRDRDLAALARAGFCHDVARRVVGMTEDEG